MSEVEKGPQQASLGWPGLNPPIRTALWEENPALSSPGWLETDLS